MRTNNPKRTRVRLEGWRKALSAALTALCVSSAAAQQAPAGAGIDATDIQRRQQQELDVQRARAQQRPDVLSAPGEGRAQPLVLPRETPCFLLRQVAWDGPEPPSQLRRLAAAVIGACVGGQGLKALQEHLHARLVEQGLVTARVLLPEQSLAGGTLTLRYLRGRIAAVRSEGAVGWWRTAMPTGPGGSFNQRDLDQALENIRRLQGQADAVIDVAPGAEPGDSDVLIKPGSGKRWHAYLGGDNAGMESTGKNQINAGLTLDSPLFLYDRLSVSWNGNAGLRRDDALTRAASIDYSVPFGYWAFSIAASRSRYRQTVAGFDAPIVYGGSTQRLDFGVSVVAYRSSRYKGTAALKLLRKRVGSRVNDVDIAVQRRDVAGYEFSYGHRQYLGRAVLDVGAGVRGTLPRFSRQPGQVYGDPAWNGRSAVLSASAGLYLPFDAAGRQWVYQLNWQIQHARTALVPADYFTIGNRYAVRGFDGQSTLAAEDGWSLRNDLSLQPGGAWPQLYAGLDAGRVGGPSAASLSGRTLVGAVAGLRGRLAMPYLKASYDLSAGWPLKKPANLKTRRTVLAASLMLEF